MNSTLQRWRKVCEAATEGPWNHEPERYSAKNVIGIKPRDDRWIASCQPEFNGDANAEFIALSRTGFPATITALEFLLETATPEQRKRVGEILDAV